MRYSVLWEGLVSGAYEVEAESKEAAELSAIGDIMYEMDCSDYKIDFTSCEAYEED